ncbi:MAG: SRPBCC domain-containing protein [Schleiferiaceae bacterium]
MIEVTALTSARRSAAWHAFTDPTHVVNWNFAGDDWCCPSCTNDVRVGGTWTSRMEARDGSFGFDFASTYTEVVEGEKIHLLMADGRRWEVEFSDEGTGTRITERFDPEAQNPEDMQRAGWQMILDRFAAYASGL